MGDSSLRACSAIDGDLTANSVALCIALSVLCLEIFMMSTKHTQPLASAIAAVAVFIVVLALAMAFA